MLLEYVNMGCQSRRAIGVMPYHWPCSTKSPAAVGLHEWPWFHLNISVNAWRGAQIWCDPKIVINYSMLGLNDCQCLSFASTSTHHSSHTRQKGGLIHLATGALFKPGVGEFRLVLRGLIAWGLSMTSFQCWAKTFITIMQEMVYTGFRGMPLGPVLS